MIPFVILVTGLPGAGKTTIARPLAEALRLPDIQLDAIKEAMFDSIGYSTRDWSNFLTVVGKDVAFRILPQIGPCVFDVFMPLAEARARLAEAVSCVIEIHCAITYEQAWVRFVARARSSQQHAGHQDADVSFDFYRTSLAPQQVDKPFSLGGPLLVVDTTDEVDLTSVSQWASDEVAQARALWHPPSRQAVR